MRNTQAHKTQFIAVFGEISACHSSDRHAGYKNFLQYDAWYKGSTAHILAHKGAWECDVASLWPNKQLPHPPPPPPPCDKSMPVYYSTETRTQTVRSHTRQHDQLHQTTWPATPNPVVSTWAARRNLFLLWVKQHVPWRNHSGEEEGIYIFC